MGKFDTLWQYQQADQELEKFELSLKSSVSYKRYLKVRSYLEEQKNIIARMIGAVEARRQIINTTKERCELLESRAQDGISKFEALDKSNLNEIERFKKYFEQLHSRIAQERREFTELVSALEKEDAQLNDMRAKLSRARKEYEELKQKIDEERDQAKENVSNLISIRDEIAKDIDKALFDYYNFSKQSNPVPMAKVVGTKCTGCNMELPAVLLRKLKDGIETVECDNCNRILIMAE